MKAISITAMIFAVAAAFAVGWLTGSHAGYTAGAESESVRIDTRATLPVPAPPVEIVEPVRSSKPAPGPQVFLSNPAMVLWRYLRQAHLARRGPAPSGRTPGRLSRRTN